MSAEITKKQPKKKVANPKISDTQNACECKSVEIAIQQNDEEWQKRMLLLILLMIIAILGLD